jgi:uncharacterized cysteine cluster protein YcgN (CxxCxxCC family)
MRFWETKTLAEMSTEEWESLCDHCGKCCLVKLEDEDTGEIAITSVVCNLIDLETCLCTRYSERCKFVPECIDLKQHDFTECKWLPTTCAYRLLTDGKPLPDWHPLISGTYDTVVKDAGLSIRSYAVKESQVDDPENHIIEWLS